MSKPASARNRDRRYRERLHEQKRAAGTLKPQGGQKGNTNGFQHGAYSLLAMRTKGRPNGNTKLGRAFRAREAESLRDLGGGDNASLAERQLVNDNVWCDFIIATMDFQLEGKRQLIRKGKPHPLIDLRMRVAAHRRENYKLHGIKRVVKVKSLAELLDEADEKEQPEKANGQSVNDEDNKPEPQSVKPMEIIESAANVPLKAQWSESTGHSQRCLNPVAGTLLSQNGSTCR